MRQCKPKPCRVCKTDFQPWNSTQVVCSPPCAAKYASSKITKSQAAEIRKQAKAARKKQRERKQALKTRSDWLREAQTAFNRFVRVRDYGKPCISSGRPMPWCGNAKGGKIDAGHYRSTGAAPHLRFNLFNCHAQSVKDNRDLSGNAADYRIGLIARIGLERVERLEQNHTIRKFDEFYLRRVKSIFTRRARLYEKLRENNLTNSL